MKPREHLQIATQLERTAIWHRQQAGQSPPDRWEVAVDRAEAALIKAPGMKTFALITYADVTMSQFKRHCRDKLKARGWETRDGGWGSGGWYRVEK